MVCIIINQPCNIKHTICRCTPYAYYLQLCYRPRNNFKKTIKTNFIVQFVALMAGVCHGYGNNGISCNSTISGYTWIFNSTVDKDFSSKSFQISVQLFSNQYWAFWTMFQCLQMILITLSPFYSIFKLYKRFVK